MCGGGGAEVLVVWSLSFGFCPFVLILLLALTFASSLLVRVLQSDIYYFNNNKLNNKTELLTSLDLSFDRGYIRIIKSLLVLINKTAHYWAQYTLTNFLILVIIIPVP